MFDYQHFQSFKLTDPITGKTKSLKDDFGGEIYNTGNTFKSLLIPEPNIITDKNENFDGERFVRLTYMPRIIEIPVFFHENNTQGFYELISWLNKKTRQVFEWENDKMNRCIKVIYNKELELEACYEKEFKGYANISFIAHDPYYRIKNEKPLFFNNINKNNNIQIYFRGNSESFPLIKITPNGTQSKIKFTWNDLNVELNNIDKPIYLDCEQERCYEIIDGKKVQVLSKYKDIYFIYPKLNGGIKNYFTLQEGDISEMKIDLRTRLI